MSKVHDSFFPPSPAAGLPRPFGRYTLVKKLAQGGMAEVFLGLQRGEFGVEKLVVVKCLLPSLGNDARFIEMFMDEARTSASLTHPNIAQVFDAGEVDGRFFIAMEYVEGRDLRTLRRLRRAAGEPALPYAHAVRIATQVLAALEYAHEKKDFEGRPLELVHRDISPQNILLDFSGSVKVVDFGVAKSVHHMAERTGVGELKGKVAYMSPEQARGQGVDWRTDLFAASVVLFEMTTGKRLFHGSSDVETLRAIYAEDYPRPSQIRSDYPVALEEIVCRGLCKDRRLRYQSARQMQMELQSFAQASGMTLSRGEFADWIRQELGPAYMEQQQMLTEVRRLAGMPDSVAKGLARRTSSRPPPTAGIEDDARACESEGPASGKTPPTLRASVHSIADDTPRRRRGWLGASVMIALLSGAVAGIVTGWVPPPPGVERGEVRRVREVATYWTHRVWYDARNQPLPRSVAALSPSPATVVFRVSPADAVLMLNDKPLKQSRARLPRLESHRLRVTAPAHIERVVDITPLRDMETVTIRLSKSPATVKNE